MPPTPTRELACSDRSQGLFAGESPVSWRGSGGVNRNGHGGREPGVLTPVYPARSSISLLRFLRGAMPAWLRGEMPLHEQRDPLLHGA